MFTIGYQIVFISLILYSIDLIKNTFFHPHLHIFLHVECRKEKNLCLFFFVNAEQVNHYVVDDDGILSTFGAVNHWFVFLSVSINMLTIYILLLFLLFFHQVMSMRWNINQFWFFLLLLRLVSISGLRKSLWGCSHMAYSISREGCGWSDVKL